MKLNGNSLDYQTRTCGDLQSVLEARRRAQFVDMYRGALPAHSAMTVYDAFWSS